MKGQTFGPSSNYTGGVPSMSLTAADVNGDGKIDLITANTGNNNITVLTNRGDRTFGSNGTYTASTPQDIVAADLNGDGKPDLASPTTSGVAIWINIGNGRFSAPTFYSVGSGHFLRAKDLNGDGSVDLVSGNGAVLTNTGAGTFALSYSANFPNDRSLAVVDMNGDGLPDWVEALSRALIVLTNAGNGRFSLLASNAVAAIVPGTICAIDAKHNGRADVIIPFYESGSGTNILVMTNDGSGLLASNSVYNMNRGPSCVTAADLNGDGLIDLSVSDISGHVLVLTNDGSGRFVTGTTLTIPTISDCVITADLNQDGRLDLVTANYNSPNVSFFFNQTPFPPASSQPALSIGRLGPGTFVSWPSDLPGWSLQKRFGIETTNWGPAGYDGYEILDDGTNHSLRVPVKNETEVFRLMHP
jgi:hypothetical protein